MRRKRIIIILGACVLAGIGVVAFWPGEKEAEYNGKKLSEWVKAYELRFDENPRFIEKEEKAADEAIRHMGTNSIPWLVRRIAYEPPPWKARFWRMVEKIPIKSIGRRYHGDGFSEVLMARLAAARAFEILGPEAAPAVPALTQIVKDGRLDFYTWGLALRALGSTGKDGLPPLLDFLGDAKLKEFAALNIVALSDTGVDITAAIPSMLMIDRETSAIEKTNIFHRSRFAIGDGETLAAMRQPHFLVSAVTNCLHHTNIVIRLEALNALGRLGHVARPAVPALKEALDDRVIAVQEAAIIALEKIAPEVLTNF